MIYLDYNATAPLSPLVEGSILNSLKRFGNPSSIHNAGRASRAAVDKTRKLLAEALGVLPRDITFTSGGTEANNMALHCLGVARENTYCSAVEHDSVLKLVAPQNHLPVDENGVVKLHQLEQVLRTARAPTLISVMWANNETGVIQPIKDIAKLCQQHGAFLHVDAVQAFGRIPISLLDGISLMTLSAHKMGGLKGVGALVSAPHLKMTAYIAGGGQERGLRAGTENTLAIDSWGQLLANGFEDFSAVAALRQQLEAGLKAANPLVHIWGHGVNRLPNTTCFSSPGHDKETQVIYFDLKGVALSSGSACSSGRVVKSHVLQAMNAPEDLANTAIRVSLGPHTTQQDIDTFLNHYKAMIG